MKRILKHISPYCLLLILFTSDRLIAQSPSVEILRLKQQYSKLDSYRATLTFKSFMGHNSSDMNDIQPGIIELSGKNVRYTMGKTEYVCNSDFMFQIDREYNEISISKPVLGGNAEMQSFAKLDTLLKKHNAISFEKLPNGLYVLNFSFKKLLFEYEKISIIYNSAYHIQKVVYYYKANAEDYGLEGKYNPRVEIEYKSQDFAYSFQTDYFSEKKYFTVKNGVIELKPSVKNCKINNLL